MELKESTPILLGLMVAIGPAAHSSETSSGITVPYVTEPILRPILDASEDAKALGYEPGGMALVPVHQRPTEPANATLDALYGTGTELWHADLLLAAVHLA